MPRSIAAILDAKIVSFLGRLALTFMFWSSGLMKLLDWKAGLGEMAHFNLSPPAAFNGATIAVQLIGSLLILFGPWAWLGAGMLGVFTALTIPLVHHFWTMEGPNRIGEMYVVMEHVSIIGALIVVAVLRRREVRR